MDRDLRIRLLLEAADRVTGPLRGIAGGSSRAAQALRATRDRLKEIERAQSQIAGFRQLKAGLRSTEQSLHATQTRVADLARQIRQTSNPTRQMIRDFERAKAEAARLTRQHETESRELQTLRDRLRAAGISTNDLARHERELRERAAGANRELQEQERRLRGVLDRQRRLTAAREQFSRYQGVATGLAVGGAAAMGTGMAMARPFLGGIKEAQAYQSAMTDIAQKADMTRQAGERMGVGLLAAAKAANQMPADLQAGVDALAGFGLDPRKATQMMQPIGRAATAYKAEIADLSKAAFAANDNLKVPIDQTGRVIDIMAQAGKSGAFEIKDMAQYFPTLTAGYQALGQTGTAAVADLAAALQIARKGAGDAASAATNVENVLQKIASPATIGKFKKFGVDLPAALKKAYAEGKTPLEAIAELTNKTLGGDLGKIGFLFEDAQVQQGLRPLIQNLQVYKRIRAEAAGASGTTDRDFAERMKDSAEQSKQLDINAKVLGITLGTMLLPTVNAVTQKLTAWANWVGEAAKRHPALAKGIALLGGGLAALLIVLGGAGIVLAGLVAPFAALATVATFFEIGMLPLIGIVAGVVLGILALGAAAYTIYANWGAIAGWFAGLWASIKAAFFGSIAAIGAMLSGFSPLGLLSAAFAALMSWLGVKIPADLATAGKNMILGLIGGITGMLGALQSTIVNAANSAAEWFKKKLGIHSPSRVFMAFGGHIMTGLSNGIAGGEDGPVGRIDSLSKRLTAAMVVGAAMPAVAAASATPSNALAGGAGMGMTIGSVTIQVYAAAGQSPADIAKAVRAELETLQREQAARQRSSFADQQDWSDRA
ncbi:phage tail tape measure protein [Sphingomonas sp. NFR15]|uniref:phage tail tape measure protein n=1 Tax=Sphingomonas sp. NFR15 TaxID=1566282 RepID=UPI000881119D|nr:phage tail tape measure protein [Sphingomonas sp. NFR15]SDA21671.1 phage tail tape measure protein, TP901 family, core region [Sphingomonas sp. NFR15]